MIHSHSQYIQIPIASNAVNIPLYTYHIDYKHKPVQNMQYFSVYCIFPFDDIFLELRILLDRKLTVVTSFFLGNRENVYYKYHTIKSNPSWVLALLFPQFLFLIPFPWHPIPYQW
jgi:hypothetical protein